MKKNNYSLVAMNCTSPTQPTSNVWQDRFHKFDVLFILFCLQQKTQEIFVSALQCSHVMYADTIS